MLKYLCIIPARGGSKGIKDKNIISINSKPLIEYTINPSLKLYSEGVINRLIVSTDSKKIASISKKLGAEVPFLRPKEISDDKSKSVEFILHALNYFEKKDLFFDAVITLQPTSPLRNYNDIHNAINLFDKYKNCNSLISCYKDEDINEIKLYKKKGNKGVPLFKSHNKGIRRQELDDVFIRNGAIYITSVKYFKKTLQIISDTPILYEMPKNRSIDLNTEKELKILEKLLS